jgi:hypothetical protein
MTPALAGSLQSHFEEDLQHRNVGNCPPVWMTCSSTIFLDGLLHEWHQWPRRPPVPPRPGVLRQQHVFAVPTCLDNPDAAFTERVLTQSSQDLFVYDMGSTNAG